jgi:predicted nucleic acid-binding protein
VRAAKNHLLRAVAAGGIQVMDLLPEDYARIADLTPVALSERLNLAEILTLDSDFDVVRRFRREPFCRVPLR